MNTCDMISDIFFIVRNVGKLTNKAQSEWGLDKWESRGVTVGLCDAGYTKMIRWGDRLWVWWTVGTAPKFYSGSKEDLIILHSGLLNE